VSIRKVKEVHAATHPGALLRRRATAVVATPTNVDDAGDVAPSDRSEVLAALAADRGDRDDDEPPR
jgi:hypothetical protein